MLFYTTFTLRLLFIPDPDINLLSIISVLSSCLGDGTFTVCLVAPFLKFANLFIITVQPKNNARARSAARTSCAVRTRNPPQEVKMSCFCGFPARTFETQEVESLTARS